MDRNEANEWIAGIDYAYHSEPVPRHAFFCDLQSGTLSFGVTATQAYHDRLLLAESSQSITRRLRRAPAVMFEQWPDDPRHA